MGQVTGRAVSYLSALRKQTLSFADETEIGKVNENTFLQAFKSSLFPAASIMTVFLLEGMCKALELKIG